MAVVTAQRQLEGGGFPVHRPFPSMALQMVDPFLLLDEMGPVDVGPREAKGAPDHPHRGFETVTMMLSGRLEHRDSHGQHGQLTPGDVQWMTAGQGVIHSEMPEQAFFEEGGRMHGIQLWVNLPAKDKMMEPRYQEIPAAKIPVAPIEGGEVRVLAGRFGDTEARIDTRTPITYLHVRLQEGASVPLARPEGHNAFVYILSGTLQVGDETVGAHQLALLDGDREARAEKDAEFLHITGKPLGEPVARYGPFVMNTRAEIQQAVEDYNAGRFGTIPAQAGGGKPYLPGRETPS